MTLEEKSAPFFEKVIRQRGRSYVSGDLVEIDWVGDDSIGATVEGTSPYGVCLELHRLSSRHILYVECDCPYFMNEDKPCKHIWALILVAERQSWPKGGIGHSRLEIVCGVGDDLGEDVFDQAGVPNLDAFADPLAEPEPARRLSETKAALHLKVVREAPPVVHLDWKDVFLASPKQAKPLRAPPLGASPVVPAVRPRQIRYALDLRASKQSGWLTIELFQREQRVSGDWGVVKPLKIDHSDLPMIGDQADQRILAMLLGGKQPTPPYSNIYYAYTSPKVGTFEMTSPVVEAMLLEALAQTGRLYLLDETEERPIETLLNVDQQGPAEFELVVAAHPDKPACWLLTGSLRRPAGSLELSAFKAMIGDRFVVLGDRLVSVVPLATSYGPWLTTLASQGGITIPHADLDQFVERLMQHPAAPRLSLPADAGWSHSTVEPAGRFAVLSSGPQALWLYARILFDYAGERFRPRDDRSAWAAVEGRTFCQRDHQAEQALVAGVMGQQEMRAVPAESGFDADVTFPASLLPHLTEALSADGWTVEAEGQLLRKAGEFRAFVASGVDWFDLEASCQFASEVVGLPKLLQALKRGESFVRLDDGTLGVLPVEWLKKFADVAALGGSAGAGIRFSRPQVALLDALLEELPEVGVDARFGAMRERLKAFSGVNARDPGPEFQGTLRQYQREGLGWLDFLADFGFGGCLADDMGLGKTIQVLAMLQDRKGRRAPEEVVKPSLLVLPRSLVHNWQQEARRFTPKLRVLDLTTSDRVRRWKEIPQHDLVLTTYALLRADVDSLRKITFDYCILDEAQAIKNDTAQVAKAARLIKADHRLAMSGTPVENHLGELGSIFAFLNPGMLPSTMLQGLARQQITTLNETTSLLAKVLRPFLLRRTKEQVLPDLPAKTEQTIFCELATEQRKLYNDLRDHYRRRLDKTIKSKGVAKSQIEVLEALLRLRQAACHPGLIDKGLGHKPSAKMNVLLEQLQEVIRGGHKALVFSQFTSMLALVKQRLDAAKIPFEYLDGSTRDRQARVEHFQSNPKVPVFLISLKAGGVGLNLTAADYCFILDPWWNPAAEAQAIDRAHRIGQTKHVFAYRLIAQDTVEEKILALQDTKRDLAAAVVSADNSHLRGLTLDDVELLLS